MMLPEDIKSILVVCRDLNVSDIHIIPDVQVCIRVEGKIVQSSRIFNQQQVNRILNDLKVPDEAYGRLSDEYTTDFTYVEERLGRFRINVTKYGESNTLSIRPVDKQIRTPNELGFDDSILNDILKIKKGMIVFTGTTSSGKSTSLYSMLKHLVPKGQHIITLDNPVENILDIPGSMVTQLEYGRDFKSFSQGISICMRKDPDIICLSEMRDIDTIKAGIMAAETGHLVFATTHTKGIEETKDRLLGAFSGEDVKFMQLVMQDVLKLIVAQELVYVDKICKRRLEYDYRLF